MCSLRAKGRTSSRPPASIVAAEIIAQAKADKVTVFKKRRRHNYRRKAGHRQQHTILKIVSIGGKGAAKKAAPKAEEAEKPAAAPAKAEKPAAEKKAAAPKAEKAPAKKEAAPKARSRQRMLHLLRRQRRRPLRPKLRSKSH